MLEQRDAHGIGPGTIVGDKFEIVRLIGRGGMGAVYEARHTVTDKRLALKWLQGDANQDPIGVTRFIREAHAAGRIRHPHVVDVYDVGEHGNGHFLVMELLHGESLADLLHRGPLGLEEAIRLLLPAVYGVGAAHREGVIHRDLKPENIFVCHNEDGSVWGTKVLDFGISKVVDSSLNLTPSGATMGTPRYMAHERMRGVPNTDHRVDVYSLGVILYEALTGRVPFDGESYGAIAVAIATETPPLVSSLRPDLPPEVDQVVHKAIARDPDERYSDIEAFSAALIELAPSAADAASGAAPQVGKPGTPSSSRKFAQDAETLIQLTPRGRARRIAAVLAVAAIVALGLALLAMSGGDSADATTEREPTSPAASPPSPDVAPTAAPEPAPDATAPLEPAQAAAAEADPTDASPATASDAEAPSTPVNTGRAAARTITMRGTAMRSTRRARRATGMTAPGRTGSLSRDEF